MQPLWQKELLYSKKVDAVIALTANSHLCSSEKGMNWHCHLNRLRCGKPSYSKELLLWTSKNEPEGADAKQNASVLEQCWVAPETPSQQTSCLNKRMVLNSCFVPEFILGFTFLNLFIFLVFLQHSSILLCMDQSEILLLAKRNVTCLWKELVNLMHYFSIQL